MQKEDPIAVEIQLGSRDVARNVTINGRLFASLVFIAHALGVAVFASGYDTTANVVGLMLSSGSVGLAVLIDGLPAGRRATVLNGITMGASVVSWLLLLTMIGR